MFFIFGIEQQEKKLPYNSTLTVHDCGQFGRYEVFVSYMVLHLFFLPLFKWNRKYYVRSTCCHQIYALDFSIGRTIERGEKVSLQNEHLTLLSPSSPLTHCPYCHGEIDEHFSYCPFCGAKL